MINKKLLNIAFTFSIVMFIVFLSAHSFTVAQVSNPSPAIQATPTSGTGNNVAKGLLFPPWKIVVALLALALLSFIIFAVFRVRKKLGEVKDDHKKPIMKLASKNAGMMGPGDSSKK